jgi:hypothetical protein
MPFCLLPLRFSLLHFFRIDMTLANKIKWVATVITLGGAIATALMFDPLNIWLLNLGAFLFLIWGFLIKDKAMITVNAGLLIIYLIGLAVRI